MSHRSTVFFTTALAPLIWGSTYLVTTEFLPPDRPFTAALLRVLPAGILLLLWRRELPKRHEWLKIFILGVLNIGFFQAMLFVSAYRLPGGLAAVLTSTQTLMVMVLMFWLGKEKLPRNAWFAAALGVVGIVLLVASPNMTFDVIGIAAALASALATAVGVYFTKQWRFSLSVVAMTGWQLLIGGLCLLPVALATEPPLPALSAANIGGYVYLCLFGSVFAYVLFFNGIKHLSPATVTSLSLLSLVCAYLLGWIFLGQNMGLLAIIGFVMALGSIYGVQRAMRTVK